MWADFCIRLMAMAAAVLLGSALLVIVMWVVLWISR